MATQGPIVVVATMKAKPESVDAVRDACKAAIAAATTLQFDNAQARVATDRLEAMIEREPITVIMSQRGWVRAMKGHVALDAADTLKFKEGDGAAFAFHAQTTDKILLAAEDGRFFTLAADKLPGGRGFGEPVRLMIDLPDGVGIVHLLPAKAFGVKVTEYMIGFGPTIWSKRRGETEYGFKAIPLGGFVSMIGMYPPNKADGSVRPSSTGMFQSEITKSNDSFLSLESAIAPSSASSTLA